MFLVLVQTIHLSFWESFSNLFNFPDVVMVMISGFLLGGTSAWAYINSKTAITPMLIASLTVAVLVTFHAAIALGQNINASNNSTVYMGARTADFILAIVCGVCVIPGAKIVIHRYGGKR